MAGSHEDRYVPGEVFYLMMMIMMVIIVKCLVAGNSLPISILVSVGWPIIGSHRLHIS